MKIERGKYLPLKVYLKLVIEMINETSNWSVYFLIPILFLFNACNITYKVRNQHNNIEQVLHMPCGKISIELVGKGNSKFVFKQKFDLGNKVIVYMDSLRIFYNRKQIEVRHNLKNALNIHEGKEIAGNKLWETSFEFDTGVFEGDTIVVVGPGYVRCKDQVISLDTLVYSFVNSLRIHGVND